MKTSKQLSQEVLEKIAQHKERQQRIRKKVGRLAACGLMVAFLVPSIVYLSVKEESQNKKPLSVPYENEQTSPTAPETSEPDSAAYSQNVIGMYEINVLI